jgi:serine protease AprX
MARAGIGAIIGVSVVWGVTVAAAGGLEAFPSGWGPSVEFNDVLYGVEKTSIHGSEVRLYHDGERTYTPEQLRAHVADQAPQVLTPVVRQMVDDAQYDALLELAEAVQRGKMPDLDQMLEFGEWLELIVILRSQPAGPIARRHWSEAREHIDTISNEIRALTRRSLPTHSMPPQLERQFVPTPLGDLDVLHRGVLAEQLDDLERDVRQQIHARIAEAVRPDQDRLAAFVEELGGQVTARVSTMNILGVRIRAGRVDALAAHPLVAKIDLNHPGQPELDNHRHSLGLETGFWAAGIDGGVYDVGVLDTGVDDDHVALVSHRFISDMGGSYTSSHGTGVAGILASTGDLYRGMAYGLDTIVVSRGSSIDVSMPGMDFIASTGEPENVNYSIGNGRAGDTDYGPTDQFFDGAIDTFGFMVSKSLGNGGWGSFTLSHPAPAYNLLAVGNIYDQNTITRADDRISSSSATGPTLGGRKKPDITAPGTDTISCTPYGTWASIGGTSAASPHVGGGIVLLYDLGTTNVMAAKAVLLNTTDAIDNHGTGTADDDEYVDGSHWNNRYGWGYLNLGAAYLHGLDVFVDSVPDQPEDADYRLYVGQMFAYERATLVWQRHVAYAGATYPTDIEDLSDLDLFAYRASDDTLLASSESPIDNVEQLHVESNGTVVLKVEASGEFDPDIPVEEFALAAQENFAAAIGPAPATYFVHPPCVAPDAQFTVTVGLPNDGDLAAHNVSVELTGITVVSGANPADLGTVAVGAHPTVSWVVQGASDAGAYPFSVSILSDSYGELFSFSADSIYEVGDCPCVGDLDGDGTVGLGDLAIMLAHYDSPGGPDDGDLTGDGHVGLADLAILLAVYDTDCP